MDKKIVIITTEHLIQQRDYSLQGEFRNILLYLVTTFSPQMILEEWKSDDHSTIGYRIAEEKMAGSWRGISPPRSLKLSWHGCRDLNGLILREYGPITLQTKREQYMLGQIEEATGTSHIALLIAGLAHHQSLAEKLISRGYEIEAFCWVGPGGHSPDCASTSWQWIGDGVSSVSDHEEDDGETN
jgi:hypothetical protein